MIYEVIGLTGAGKTYWSGQYAREKSLQYVTLGGRWWRYKNALLFVINRPLLAFQIFRLAFIYSLSNRGIIKHKLLYIMLNAYAREYLATSQDADVIIDDGILQFVFSIYEQKISRRIIQNDFNFSAISDRVVLQVTAPKVTRIERMKKRGRFLRHTFSDAERERYTEVFEHNFQVISEELSTYFNLIEIKND